LFYFFLSKCKVVWNFASISNCSELIVRYLITRLVIGTSRTVGSAKKFVRITSGFGGGEFNKTLRKVCTCQKLKMQDFAPFTLQLLGALVAHRPPPDLNFSASLRSSFSTYF
jgi:hypothetical protein